MPRRARPSGIFHCRGKARGHIYEHTKHVTRVGQCSKQRIDILEWSSARTLSRVFTLRFFSKGLFNSHYATFFIALTRKLWSFHSCWSKAACAFCHVSIFMGEGDSISIVLGISGAKPRHRKALQRIKIGAAPFPCYYAFLEREVPSTTKGAKVGKGKSPLDFKAASFFGALL